MTTAGTSTLRRITWETELGILTAIGSDSALMLLEFDEPGRLEEQMVRYESLFVSPIEDSSSPVLDETRRQMDAYLRRELKVFDLPLDLQGTDFQVKVWKELLRIPYAETRSYGQLADKLGLPGGSRAVGKANGENRIAVIVPCHRVIRSDGELCGYGGGVWRKRFLLDLEQGSSLFT